jgi:hypothetical protein
MEANRQEVPMQQPFECRVQTRRAPRVSSLAGTFLACLLVAACGDDEQDAVATSADVLEACGEYAATVCASFGACLGETESAVAACVEDVRSDCRPNLGPETCWEEQLESFEGCTERVQDESCDLLCPDDFCFDQCLWFCPPPPAAAPQTTAGAVPYTTDLASTT